MVLAINVVGNPDVLLCKVLGRSSGEISMFLRKFKVECTFNYSSNMSISTLLFFSLLLSLMFGTFGFRLPYP